MGIPSAHDAMGSVAYVTKEQYLCALFLVRIVGTIDFGALFSAFARGALGQWIRLELVCNGCFTLKIES